MNADPGATITWPIAHYVLFGPAGQPATQVNLWLARAYLLAFAPAFGFSPSEAAEAGHVTIIADTVAVSASIEQHLTAGGAQVQRVAGSVSEIAQALDQRVRNGRPF